jgi:DnaJ-class molecular chaperone
MLDMLNYHQSLNVDISADLATIKKAYYKISLLHHPDTKLHLPSPSALSESICLSLST